jgi:hypothetical protein
MIIVALGMLLAVTALVVVFRSRPHLFLFRLIERIFGGRVWRERPVHAGDYPKKEGGGIIKACNETLMFL